MKTVLCTALGLVLAAGLGFTQEPAGGKPAGGEEDLDKAAAKAGTMTNYSCTITLRAEGMEGEGQAIPPVEIQIKPDAPWHLKSGEVEAYRKGDALVVKEGAAWKRLERSDGGAKAAQALRMVRGPHEILISLKTSSFKEVKKEDSEGGRCFSGELTPEALGQFAVGRIPPKSTGTAKVWVNAEGVVTKYEVALESKMKDRGGQEITVKRTSTVEIRDIGSAKYDVPEEAAKAFEG